MSTAEVQEQDLRYQPNAWGFCAYRTGVDPKSPMPRTLFGRLEAPPSGGKSFCSVEGMFKFVRATSLAVSLSLVAAACGRISAAEHVKRADDYAAKKDFANAIVEYRSALQQDPKLGTARLRLGDIYAQISDGQNAYREYVRAADTMPDNVDAQLKAGALLLLSNQYAEAKTRAEAVLRLSPRNPGALTLLGNALAGMNDTDGALDRLNEAILADPSQGSLYLEPRRAAACARRPPDGRGLVQKGDARHAESRRTARRARPLLSNAGQRRRRRASAARSAHGRSQEHPRQQQSRGTVFDDRPACARRDAAQSDRRREARPGVHVHARRLLHADATDQGGGGDSRQAVRDVSDLRPRQSPAGRNRLHRRPRRRGPQKPRRAAASRTTQPPRPRAEGPPAPHREAARRRARVCQARACRRPRTRVGSALPARARLSGQRTARRIRERVQTGPEGRPQCRERGPRPVAAVPR